MYQYESWITIIGVCERDIMVLSKTCLVLWVRAGVIFVARRVFYELDDFKLNKT